MGSVQELDTLVMEVVNEGSDGFAKKRENEIKGSKWYQINRKVAEFRDSHGDDIAALALARMIEISKELLSLDLSEMEAPAGLSGVIFQTRLMLKSLNQ